MTLALRGKHQNFVSFYSANHDKEKSQTRFMTILGDHKAAHFVRQGVAPGGGNPYTTGVGMLFVSLRGINFGFWSRLGCSGQNTIIFSRKGLF